jgi:hypothetical protein
MHIKWLEDKGTKNCVEEAMLTHRTDCRGSYSVFLLHFIAFTF